MLEDLYRLRKFMTKLNKPFEGLLGNNCELRMLEYLLPLDGIEFNISELNKEVGVSRIATARIVKKFVKWGVLNQIGTGNDARYGINKESPIIKSIEQFNNTIIEKILGNEILYEIHEYLETRKSTTPASDQL